MTKLIFEYYWGDGYTCSGTETIPFEWSSVEDFQLMVLGEIEEYRKLYFTKYNTDKYYRNGSILIIGRDFNVGNLEDSIENYVYELNDWFETKKYKK